MRWSFHACCDPFLGKSIRRIKDSDSKTIYLTFDDGPDALGTPRILRLLSDKKVSATFFMIAEKALAKRSLVQEVLSQGHRIGNHSLDHDCKMFFKAKDDLKVWIQSSEEILQNLIGTSTVGFRSPLGIRTPALHRALRELQTPLILWSMRFYDTAHLWTPEKAERAAEIVEDGEIVLLHDAHQDRHIDIFMKSLGIFVDRALERGYKLKSLPPQNSTISLASATA